MNRIAKLSRRKSFVVPSISRGEREKAVFADNWSFYKLVEGLSATLENQEPVSVYSSFLGFGLGLYLRGGSRIFLPSVERTRTETSERRAYKDSYRRERG